MINQLKDHTTENRLPTIIITLFTLLFKYISGSKYEDLM